MNEKQIKNELAKSSHIVILISFTLLSVILIGESLLLRWETWAVILIAAGLVIAWTLHIRQALNEYARQWIYSLMMMATFFFYGSHPTSTYDLCGVMGTVIIIYSMTGSEELIYLCQGTYAVTYAYALVSLVRAGEHFDALLITRSFLHMGLILLMSSVACVIIDRWGSILGKVRSESSDLKKQIERLNDFLANISHEIRTPVNAIIGLSGVCVKAEKDEKIKTDLEAVSAAGRRIGELTADILDYSEIDMQRLAVNAEDYMLSSLLNDIVMEIKPRMREEVELVIDVDPDIPSVMNTDVGKLKKILKHLIDNALKYTNEGGVYVHLSSERREYGINLCIEVADTGIGMNASEVEQVFERFYQADSGRARTAGGLGLGLSIVNGFVRSLNGFLTLDSEPGKGTSVRVSIPQGIIDDQKCMSLKPYEGRALGAYLHFEKFPNPQIRYYYNLMVRDLTMGLDVKMQRADNLEDFKKLCRATRFTHVFVGKEEYEEDIEFMEELARDALVAVVADDSFVPDDGSHIRIMRKPFYCFPVISFLNTFKGVVEEEEGRLYARGVRALVVDDEPMNHMVTREILSGYGMIVSTASSGMEAIDLVSANEYDIIFMDHMMPGMDGVEAMKRIKLLPEKEKRELPIVALTANAVSTAREMFLREGFDGFIAKPIEIYELERVLRRVLPKSVITIEVDDVSSGVEEKNKAEKGLAETEAYRELESLGVDTAEGLRYSQNDRYFYEQLLLQYGREASDKRSKLDAYLRNKDYRSYGVIIHSIKSSSKMIGAMDLFEKAKHLEEAAEASDGDEITRTHYETMAEYDSLSDAIICLFDGTSAQDRGGHGSFDPDVFLEFEPEMGEVKS